MYRVRHNPSAEGTDSVDLNTFPAVVDILWTKPGLIVDHRRHSGVRKIRSNRFTTGRASRTLSIYAIDPVNSIWSVLPIKWSKKTAGGLEFILRIQTIVSGRYFPKPFNTKLKLPISIQTSTVDFLALKLPNSIYEFSYPAILDSNHNSYAQLLKKTEPRHWRFMAFLTTCACGSVRSCASYRTRRHNIFVRAELFISLYTTSAPGTRKGDLRRTRCGYLRKRVKFRW